MGTYLIPGAVSVHEAAAFVGEPPLTASWSYADGGILFEDTSRTDAQCASAYAGYVPSGLSDSQYVPALSPQVEAARDVLRQFWNANPNSVTDAQTASVLRALLAIVRDMNRRID